MAEPQERPKSKWYHNLWFVLFTLFFVAGPFGLPLVWKNPRFSRRLKITLTVVVVFYTIALVQTTIRIFQIVIEEVNRFKSTLQ